MRFPPLEKNSWVLLNQKERLDWLNKSRHYCLNKKSSFSFSKEINRVIILDGELIDSLLAFYCAIGEAVNGAGGYFGTSLEAFDDCLFGGFGLEFPYQIIWKNSDKSAQFLNSKALIEYLNNEYGKDTSILLSKEYVDDMRNQANLGTRTLFQEITSTITSVTSRGGGKAELVLA